MRCTLSKPDAGQPRSLVEDCSAVKTVGVARASRKELQRDRFVAEVAEYLVQNNGPDKTGSAHPSVRRVDVGILEDAIKVARSRGLEGEWRPYHFKGHFGTYSRADFVDELLAKHVDVLLSDTFGGDTFRLLTEATAEQLRASFTETIAGRDVIVSMATVSTKFRDSPFEMLARYREIKKLVQYAGIRPYHMRGKAAQGTYEDARVVEEVLVKGIDVLLRDTFGGDTFRLLTEATAEQLRASFTETIAGRDVIVSMATVSTKFRDSPFEMLTRYREIKKLLQYAGIRPYHTQNTSMGIYNDPAVVEEVLVRGVDILLRDVFGGDVFRLLTEATQEQLLSPFSEEIGGREVTVSMASVARKFRHSPFEMLARYREIRGLHQFAGLRPYHMQNSSKGTYDEPKIVDEMLVKAVDTLLRNTFGGDLFRLFTEATLDQLLTSFTEEVSGRGVTVSMHSVGAKFRNSPYEMLARYREVKGMHQYAGFRPYHMQNTPIGIYNDPAVVDEVLAKRVDILLRNSFGGDLFRLFIEATLDQLLASFTEEVAGRDVTVSMHGVGARFRNSPYAMLARYREIRGLHQYAGILRHHRLKAPMGAYDDRKTAEAVLVQRIDTLLADTFGGDTFRLLTEVTQRQLLAPYRETVAGHEVTVSMSQVGRQFSCSPYMMIKRYFQIKSRKADFTPECLVGSPETRARRLRGEFNAYDRQLMRTAEGDFDTSRFGMRVFHSTDKISVRELMVEQAMNVLGETPIRYLGLEDQHLEGIRLIRNYLNLAPESSVIVEREERVVRAMNALRGALPNGEGRALKQVTICHGSLEDEISRLEGKFNLANLDFVGHLSNANVTIIRELLSGRLEDKAIISVTLMDTPLARVRTQHAGLGSGGAKELPRIVAEVSKECGHYALKELGEIPYSGGTGGNQTPMITYMFLAERL